MSTELTGIRPAVLSQSTRLCLDEYREFRHVVRNVYTFNLRTNRLDNLASELGACFSRFSQDIAQFISFLEQVSQADDQLTEEL
ncbi:MAG: hypothetical protein RMK99_02775 [Anaerolineales bacterium]|nr:hypothetical protein [Anaerolineales bacterium]